MGLLNWIKGVWNRLFKKEAQETFNVDVLLSTKMEQEVKLWEQIYLKNPPWVDEKIKTIGFGKVIASETARLATLELEITVDGSARATYLQGEINKFKDKIRTYLEYACAYGGIFLKPSGKGIDYVLAGNFIPTETDGNDNINAGIFFDFLQKGDKHYTRMEYHRFIESEEQRLYAISNRAYVSEDENELGKPINLLDVPEWSVLEPDVFIDGLEKTLFAYLKMPMANGVDIDSPLGVSIYSDAVEELKDLDIAFSLNSREIEDSEKILLLDDRLMNATGTNLKTRQSDIELPHYVHNVFGSGADEFYKEINPQLNTDTRLTGINNLLSFIGYKCGFSNGYFSFDKARGLKTATQVEAEDKRTIETIADVRTSLKSAIEHLIYALDKYADLYGLASFGTYEISYYFKDITVSFAEDRQRYYNLAMAGKFPWKKYYMEYEGYSEDEVDELLKMIAEENKQPTLYDDLEE